MKNKIQNSCIFRFNNNVKEFLYTGYFFYIQKDFGLPTT